MYIDPTEAVVQLESLNHRQRDSYLEVVKPQGFVELSFTEMAGVNNSVFSTTNSELNDRALNVPETTQQEQLGVYQDATEVTHTQVNSEVYQGVYQTCNMEVFDMNKSMDRQYEVSSFVWKTDDGMVISYPDVTFPSALFSQNYIATKASDFSLFRAGIRVGVRVQSSRFLFGKLLVYYVPDDRYAREGAFNDVYRPTGYPHVLVSASSSDTVYLDIPFISPKRFIDLTNYVEDEMGRVKFMVLNPLTNITGDSDNCRVVVTAQFIDAELALPRDTLSSSFVVTTSKREAIAKSEAMSVASKYTSSVVSGGALAVRNFAKPFVSIFKRTASAVAAHTITGAVMSLDKPGSVAATTIVQETVVPRFANGRGLSVTNKATMDPEAMLSVVPDVGGVSQDEMSLSYVCGTPMLTSVYKIDDTTPDTVVASTNPNPNPGRFTYVDFVLQNFRYYSGSFKFKVYITASLMHSARLVFYLAQNVMDWQDCYHRIVDVQGDTTTEFTIPYCQSEVLSDIYSDNHYWNVYVHVMSYSQPTPGVATPIWINVYKSGADDLRFGRQLEMEFVQTTSNPRADFTNVFEPLHPSMKAYVPDSVIYPEEFKSVRDIVHRDYPYGLTAGANNPGWVYFGDTSYTTTVIGKEIWGILYLFWRGSIRAKVIRRNNVLGVVYNTAIFAKDMDQNRMIPGLDLSFPNRPMMELEIPYYSDKLYKSTRNGHMSAPNLGFACSSTDLTNYVSMSCGDDFSFHFLAPPFNGNLYQVTPAATTYGYQGLYEALANPL